MEDGPARGRGLATAGAAAPRPGMLRRRVARSAGAAMLTQNLPDECADGTFLRNRNCRCRGIETAAPHTSTSLRHSKAALYRFCHQRTVACAAARGPEASRGRPPCEHSGIPEERFWRRRAAPRLRCRRGAISAWSSLALYACSSATSCPRSLLAPQALCVFCKGARATCALIAVTAPHRWAPCQPVALRTRPRAPAGARHLVYMAYRSQSSSTQHPGSCVCVQSAN